MKHDFLSLLFAFNLAALLIGVAGFFYCLFCAIDLENSWGFENERKSTLKNLSFLFGGFSICSGFNVLTLVIKLNF